MPDRVTLDNLGKGAAAELFNVELQKVLDNILDENTKATAVREVILKVTIKPDEERDTGDVKIQATSKLAPIAPFDTNFLIGKQKGKAVATEYNPRAQQQKLFKEETPDNVLPIAKEGQA